MVEISFTMRKPYGCPPFYFHDQHENNRDPVLLAFTTCVAYGPFGPMNAMQNLITCTGLHALIVCC
jgi:hypothetical protein